MHSSCAAALLAPWARFAGAALAAVDGPSPGAGVTPAPTGQSPGLGADGEIVLGTSAAFTGPSRGLGNELYRGAMAYFRQVNDSGGIDGRRVTLK
ncbi:MAG: ABC transporter substrate-binding protein, partial [Acidobacteria bacterium]|nr:ABC transporter substrate-binding protein [Acidobacteriota bacterium]